MNALWVVAIAGILLFSPAARKAVRDAAATIWQAAKGVVKHIRPVAGSAFWWTMRIGAAALGCLIIGLWQPWFHVVGAGLLIAWFFMWLAALIAIAEIIEKVNISIPIPGAPTSAAVAGSTPTTASPLTINGKPIADALRAVGRPIGLLVMFLLCWIVVQTIAPPELSGLIGLIMLLLVLFMAGFILIINRGLKFLGVILVVFYWIVLLMVCYQGFVRATKFGRTIEDKRQVQVRKIINRITGSTVDDEKKERSQESQIEFDRLQAYPFRESLWSNNPLRKGMELPIFNGGSKVTNRDEVIQTLRARGSWHPTEERVPKEVLTQLAVPMVVIEAPDNRTIKYIVPSECLVGYMAKSPTDDLELARQQTSRAVQKKSLYEESSKSLIIEKINRIRVVRTSIAPTWWWQENGEYKEVRMEVKTIAEVLGRTGDLPDQPVSIPVKDRPREITIGQPALYIQILEGKQVGATGWLPAEFADWIENPF